MSATGKNPPPFRLSVLALAGALAMPGGCSSFAGSVASSDTGITTTLADVWPECPWLDTENLGEPKPLDALPRGADGRQLLPRGVYVSGTVETY
jgi:hypothetical protein